jgi:hypothetical protein
MVSPQSWDIWAPSGIQMGCLVPRLASPHHACGACLVHVWRLRWLQILQLIYVLAFHHKCCGHFLHAAAARHNWAWRVLARNQIGPKFRVKTAPTWTTENHSWIWWPAQPIHKEHNQIWLLKVENNLTKYGEKEFDVNRHHATSLSCMCFLRRWTLS